MAPRPVGLGETAVIAPRVLRSSRGRVRLTPAAPAVAGESLASRLVAVEGVREVRVGARTGNLLVLFDPLRTSEQEVLERAWARVALPGRVDARRRPASPAPAGWVTVCRSFVLDACARDCRAVLLDVERYPTWQRFVDAVTVVHRDRRGRPALVRTRGAVAGLPFEHTLRYGYPSGARIVFEQVQEGAGDAVRGEWRVRRGPGERVQVTYRLEIAPAVASARLRGTLFEAAQNALVEHLLGELRRHVE